MNVLALDLSTKSTGYAIQIDNKIIDYGYVASTSKKLEKRIFIIKEKIKELILQYKIDTIVIEEVTPQNNFPNIYKALTMLHGVINVVVFEINPKIEIKRMMASSWRKLIGIKTGKGIKREELKQEDIKKIKEIYNIDTINDDIADALCILAAYNKTWK